MGENRRKKIRRNGETSQKRRDGGVGVIGKCSDSPIDQEVLCIHTKDDSEGLGEALPGLVFKPIYHCNSTLVIMFNLSCLDINFPT